MIRILKFISLCKSQSSRTKVAAAPPPSKKAKIVQHVNNDESSENIPSVTNDIRQNIIKLIRDYNKGQFATLEEGKDYSIQVSKSTVDHKKSVASITCKCGKAYKVTTEKPTKQRIITNWSKHLKKCEYKKDQSIQHSLQNYLIPPATAAPTLTTTTTGGGAAEPCLVTDSNATDQPDQSILQSLLFTFLNEVPISSSDPSDPLPLRLQDTKSGRN